MFRFAEFSSESPSVSFRFSEVCTGCAGGLTFLLNEVCFEWLLLFSAGSTLGSLDRALDILLRLNSETFGGVNREATPFSTINPNPSLEPADSALHSSDNFAGSVCSDVGSHCSESAVKRP